MDRGVGPCRLSPSRSRLSWAISGQWGSGISDTPLCLYAGLSVCLWPLTELGRGAEGRLWLVLCPGSSDSCPAVLKPGSWQDPLSPPNCLLEQSPRRRMPGSRLRPQSGPMASKAVFVSSPACAKGNLSQGPQARGRGCVYWLLLWLLLPLLL